MYVSRFSKDATAAFRGCNVQWFKNALPGNATGIKVFEACVIAQTVSFGYDCADEMVQYRNNSYADRTINPIVNRKKQTRRDRIDGVYGQAAYLVFPNFMRTYAFGRNSHDVFRIAELVKQYAPTYGIVPSMIVPSVRNCDTYWMQRYDVATVLRENEGSAFYELYKDNPWVQLAWAMQGKIDNRNITATTVILEASSMGIELPRTAEFLRELRNILRELYNVCTAVGTMYWTYMLPSIQAVLDPKTRKIRPVIMMAYDHCDERYDKAQPQVPALDKPWKDIIQEHKTHSDIAVHIPTMPWTNEETDPTLGDSTPGLYFNEYTDVLHNNLYRFMPKALNIGSTNVNIAYTTSPKSNAEQAHVVANTLRELDSIREAVDVDTLPQAVDAMLRTVPFYLV